MLPISFCIVFGLFTMAASDRILNQDTVFLPKARLFNLDLVFLHIADFLGCFTNLMESWFCMLIE